MVLKDKRNHCFFVCNLWPDFKKVKFDVRRSLEPFKDLDGRFDPSLTALTKRSQTLSNGTCVSCILSAGVWDRLWSKKAYCSVTQRYCFVLNCVVNLFTPLSGSVNSLYIPRLFTLSCCYQRCSLDRDRIQMTHFSFYDHDATQSECAHRLVVIWDKNGIDNNYTINKSKYESFMLMEWRWTIETNSTLK